MFGSLWFNCDDGVPENERNFTVGRLTKDEAKWGGKGKRDEGRTSDDGRSETRRRSDGRQNESLDRDYQNALYVTTDEKNNLVFLICVKKYECEG